MVVWRLTTTPPHALGVLEHLRTVHPQAELHLALGPDNAAPTVFRRFKNYQRLVEEFGLVTLEERIHVRSTWIRAELGRACPDRRALESALAITLTGHLLGNGLYKNGGITA